MWKYIMCLVLFEKCYSAVLWENSIECPILCTCRYQHLTETAIHRFSKKHKDAIPISQTDFHENNDVFDEDDYDKQLPEDMLRSATCIIQTETDPLQLINSLPKDIEALTLIQGSGSGNKSITFTALQSLNDLIILELQGTQLMKVDESSHFFCEIDASLPNVKYINFDRVSLKNTRKQFDKFENEVHEEVVVFEYTQQLNPKIHPLTMVQRGTKRDILPYNKYTENDSNELLLFGIFHNLVLLRVTNCELNSVNWEMFDGLSHLEYLILENNHMMFIPDFAFYGTPTLKSLSLAWNKLLNIQITDLAGLLELEYLDLSHNNFSQLSELSFPPFPKLKLANFANNPISVVFPSTFEVMNTTDSLILGGEEMHLHLLPNSFLGLKLLKQLTLLNLQVPILKRELLVGMPNLNELIMSGNISETEFDAFLDVNQLEKLVLSRCNLQNLSMDTFIGLNQLKILDLSANSLEAMHPGIFDDLKSLKELYLNGNRLTNLPRDIFHQIHPKLIRLNDNPWHCSCKMSDWKPMIVNKIKQKEVRICEFHSDKGAGCVPGNFLTKYVFDTRVAPTCATPKKFVNWNVFHVMRKQLRCEDYKPKIRKISKNHHVEEFHAKAIFKKSQSLKIKQDEIKNADEQLDNSPNNEPNNLDENIYLPKIKKIQKKVKKIRKTFRSAVIPPHANN